MNNLNPDCVVGDVAVILYDIQNEYGFFRIGDHVTITDVLKNRNAYEVKRSYSSDVYFVDKAMLIKKEYWQMMRKAILADAVRMLSE